MISILNFINIMNDYTTTNPLLTLSDLDVGRGDFVLCQGVNLTLYAGDICHLTGENGLGKTTLLNQIAGLLPLLSGQVSKNGRLVYVSHQLGISPDLTVAQNLRFLLSLYNITTDDDTLNTTLDAVGLWGLGDTKSSQLSAGQTRRVSLARLFLLDAKHAPIWLLDEPLTALDVAMVETLQARMKDFAQSGGTILTTSHQTILGTNKQLDLTDFAL